MLAEIAEWESAEGNWSDIWRRPRPPAPMNARSRCRPTIHGDGDRTAALTAGGSSRSTSPTCSQALRSSDIPLAHASDSPLALPHSSRGRPPGGTYLAWPNQVVVNVDELNLRRSRTIFCTTGG